MVKITFNNNVYNSKPGETVLDTLIRANVSIPFSCRNGICHTCMLRAIDGKPSKESQKTLSKSLCEKNYFLPCKCVPDQDINIRIPQKQDLYSTATLLEKEMLNETVCRMVFEPIVPLYYHAGQFINIRRDDGTVRSYSLASFPAANPCLEIHVKRFKNGVMSNWLIDELPINGNVEFHGPLGDCYYRNEFSEASILLIATGTGLSPLQGVIQDALHSNHKGNIYLYHGCSRSTDLYNSDILRQWQQQHSNFHYYACVSKESGQQADFTRRASDIAFEKHPELEGYIIYLAGNPDMVYSAFETAANLGADCSKIYADAFEAAEVLQLQNAGHKVDQEYSALHAGNDSAQTEPLLEDPPYPAPDPELWQALQNGELLLKILKDFYTQVYHDEKLNGFFKDVTKQRAIEKQYNFLRRVFTGEKVYFGEKPRNAHHWMVISDELFGYREALIEASMKKFGLPDNMIQRWLDLHEIYRKVIVKPEAWKKIFAGEELPLEGYEALQLDIGSVCDGCSNVLEPGDNVTYHVRLGTIYCTECRQHNS